jgi:hypothetical protein
MPGVKAVEKWAFEDCEARRIGYGAFRICASLMGVFLPSVKIVEADAFDGCEDLTDVKFGDKLETIEDWAFYDCPSLERITIPLKNGMDIFKGCENLEHVKIWLGNAWIYRRFTIGELKKWHEYNNQFNWWILPNTTVVGKAPLVRMWIELVLRKIVDYNYKQQHRKCIDGSNYYTRRVCFITKRYGDQ